MPALTSLTQSSFSAAPSGTPAVIPPFPQTSPPQTHPSLTSIISPVAPPAIGPYSHAIKAGDLIFVSGNLPLDHQGALVGEGDVVAQTHQVLANLKSVVEAGGSEIGQVVKTTVFLKDLNDFNTVNGIYGQFFGQHRPARSAIEISRLPRDVLVEIEAIVSTSQQPLIRRAEGSINDLA